jgi:hypothetical protein
MEALLAVVKQLRAGEAPVLDERLIEAARKTLTTTGMDMSAQAYTLALPSEVLLAEVSHVCPCFNIPRACHMCPCWSIPRAC